MTYDLFIRRRVTRLRAITLLTTLLTVGVAACGGTELPPAASVLRDDVADATTTFGDDTAVPDSIVDATPPGASSSPRTSSTTPGQAETVGIVAGEWQDITSNLVGLESTCGNVSYLKGDPFGDDVFVDIAARGLFALADDGSAWNPIGQDGDQIDHRTQWIELDPAVRERFWVSGAYGSGVFRTDDGGGSFQRLSDLTHLDRVAVDMTDPDRATLLAGSHEDRLLYKSTDGGQSWVDISEALPAGIGFASTPVILGPDSYLLGTYRGEQAGIFRSDDGGATWTQVYDGDVIGVPVVTDDYIAWNRGTGSGGIAVSTDGGRTFTPSASGPGRPSATLVTGPEGTLVTATVNGVAVTSDLGETWARIGDDLPFEPDGVAYSAARGTMYAWRLTCSFDDGGNPVEPQQIMQAPLTPGG